MKLLVLFAVLALGACATGQDSAVFRVNMYNNCASDRSGTSTCVIDMDVVPEVDVTPF